MSVKAVNKYYDQICRQYNEMLENIKDLEEEAEKGFVEPERVDRFRDQIAPLKQNYERWTYMMFLLHQPNKKDKHKKYAGMHRRKMNLLSPTNSIDATISENDNVLSRIGE